MFNQKCRPQIIRIEVNNSSKDTPKNGKISFDDANKIGSLTSSKTHLQRGGKLDDQTRRDAMDKRCIRALRHCVATHVKNSLVRKKKIRSNPQLLYDFVVENHLSQLSMFTDHDDSKSNLMKVFGHISYMLMKTKYKDYIRKFNENVFTLEEQDQMINEVDDYLQKNNNQVSSEFRKIALEHPVTRLGKHFLEV